MISLRFGKQTIYIYKNKFTPHKEYLFGLIFSKNQKKIYTDYGYYKHWYSVGKEAFHNPLKLTTIKNFFYNVYVTVTTCFDKCFLFHVITGRH